MGTESLTDEQIAAAQAAELKQLRETVARLSERLGPDPDAAPAAVGDTRRVVYKAQADPDPKQLDHPGWDAKIVRDQVEYDRAIADGWQDEHGPFVYVEADEQIAVIKKGQRVKK